MGRPPKLDLPNDFRRLLKTVGSNLRAYREKRNLSQAELARQTRVSLATINEIESRSFRDIRLSTLFSLSQKLEIPAVSLLLGSDLDHVSSSDHVQLLKASETILRISKKIRPSNKSGKKDHTKGED